MGILLTMVKPNSIDPHSYFLSNLMFQSNLMLIYHLPFIFHEYGSKAVSIQSHKQNKKNDEYQDTKINVQYEKTHKFDEMKTKKKNRK